MTTTMRSAPRSLAIALACAAALSACAPLPRLDSVPAADHDEAVIDGIPNARFYFDGDLKPFVREVVHLLELQKENPIMTAVRGRGLFLAFDLPDPATRNQFWKGLFEGGALALKSGEKAIRFRPALDMTKEVVDEAIDLLRQQCQRMGK